MDVLLFCYTSNFCDFVVAEFLKILLFLSTFSPKYNVRLIPSVFLPI